MVFYPKTPRANTGSKKRRKPKETLLLELPRPKIYLAGPDVFRADAKLHGQRLKDAVFAAGGEPLWPFDNEVAGEGATAAEEIFAGNCAMLQACAAVVANISPFRGPNMDPGTAFEIGYAIALGKPVVLYSYAFIRDFAERTNAMALALGDYPTVENFGLTDNLMICAGVGVLGSFEAALVQVMGMFPRDGRSKWSNE